MTAQSQGRGGRLRPLTALSLAAAVLLAGGAAARAQTTTVAGVTPGAIAVDESGSANYSIPLSVPPGVAGMAPSLSLIYGSRGDNGILGVGWSLGGLSVIHRCGRSIAQDGAPGGVDLSADDRFCLDGQRLVATDGAYGADGTVYSTELASFARIVSNGTAGTGPASFKVWTKSGQVMTYGATADAAVEAPDGATIRYWSVNRIEDRVGNYLDLVYAEDDPADGTPENTHKIDRIDYAGNTVAGTLPTASVRFVYEPRTDTRVHYTAGARSQTVERLQAIETYARYGSTDSLVKRYDLAYDTGAATGRSRLTSLTECDAGDNCLEPHSFTYSDPQPGNSWTYNTDYNAVDIIVDKPANLTRGMFVDLNADGLPDWVRSYRTAGGTIKKGTWLKTATGWEANVAYELPDIIDDRVSNYLRGEFVDVNGDGLVDWVRAYRNASGVYKQATWLNTGSDFVVDAGYQLPDIIYDAATRYKRGAFVDVNGDGLVDWVRSFINGDNVHKHVTYLNTGSGWQPDGGYLLPDAIYDAPDDIVRGQFQDVNGDGLVDWVRAYRNASGVYKQATWLNTGSGWAQDAAYALPDVIVDKGLGLTRGQFQDLNGDGLVDWVRAYRKTNGNVSQITWLNTGHGWEQDSNYTLPDVIRDNGLNLTRGEFQDVNGDGLVDWVKAYRKSNGGVVQNTWLNTGSGWQQNNDYILPDVIDDRGLVLIRGQFQDINGDGLKDWMRSYIKSNGGSSVATWLNQSGTPDLLLTATDGLGRVAEIIYKPLTDPSVYSKGSGASFPELDLVAPLYVVASVSQDDGQTAPAGGVEGDAVMSYSYAGARVDTRGRGFLGFRTVTAKDEQTQILTTTSYNQSYPFTGQVDSSVSRLDNGEVTDPVKEVETTFASLTIFDGTATNQPSVLFPYAEASTSRAYEIGDFNNAGFLVSSTTTTSSYDSYGNATLIEQEVIDAADAAEVYSTVTSSLYDNDEVNWILGRVTSTTVTKSRPSPTGPLSETRTSAWEYDLTNGLLTKEIIEPDIPALKVTTSYTYDVYGNSLTATVSGQGIVSRGSTTTYDAIGQFLVSSSNALGHSETTVTDPRFGVVTSQTGPNGITTAWEYDGFGRKTRELRADGTESQVSFDLCGIDCPDGAVYRITSQDFLTSGGTAIGTPSVQYYDKMNRVFHTQSIAFDGVTKIFVDTRYNPRGESHMVSRPYFEGTAALDIMWATTHYDILGRRLSVIAPDGGIQDFDYGGLTIRTTNALFQDMTRTQNVIGELVTATDHLAGTVSYLYDAFGNLLETDAGGVVTSMSYDLRGRKTAMTDPDMGNWSYVYNLLGELVSQTDAKGQTVTMTYDLLGRMVSRSEAEGLTTWTYDTAARGIGKIHQVSGPNAYLEVAGYDSLGRPDTTTTTIAGEVYNTSLTYDALGRPSTITYPSGFTVQNNYTANGFLGSVSEILGGTVYWQANTVDAEGMVTRETLGNGVVTDRVYDPATALVDSLQTTHGGASIQNLSFAFDPLGNLTERQDLMRDRSESFTYDGLNRLLTSSLTDSATAATLNATSLSYDALGNITSKSDVGSYLYGQNGAGPHAVTTAGSNTYSYDANGSMISGAGRTTSWTSFNKPLSIDDSLSGNQTAFVYGPNRSRIQQNSLTDGLTTTTTYIGGSYERRSRLNQPDELVHYIRAGGGTVAIFTEIDDGQALTDKTRYLHKDHLGSVESITDELGAVTEHLSYDAHGKRRLTDWQAGTPAIPGETPRGFTGHEHLDGVGLIHMNGRVYDPTLGRFLSADPNVQAPSEAQSFNRYSYVNNNPLSYTDPSGFFFKKLFSKIGSFFKKYAPEIFGGLEFRTIAANKFLSTAVIIGVNFIPGLQGWASVLVAAAFSGLASYSNSGGDLGQALLSAGITFASAVFSAGIGEGFGHSVEFFTAANAAKTVAHGVVGGVISKFQGGNFQSGFLSSAVGALAAPAIGNIYKGVKTAGAIAARTAVAAVAGGVGAVLGGGKFINGAATTAMQHLLNGEGLLKRQAVQKGWNQMVSEFKSSIVEAYEMGEALDVDGYIKKVETNGDWDFKNRAEYKSLPGVEEFGNFAFGATAQAWADGATGGLSTLLPNVSINMAMRGAGWYQQYRQPKQYNPSDGSYSDWPSYPGSTNYGDNWRDGANVWMGGQYYFRNRDSLLGN